MLGNCTLVASLGFAPEPGAHPRSSPLLGRHGAVVTGSPAPASLRGGAARWVLGSCSFSKFAWFSREGSVLSCSEGGRCRVEIGG